MRWDELEKALVSTIKSIIRSDSQLAAELCAQYSGEFQAPWSLPEDYNPGKRYALIQFQTGTASSTGKGSVFDMTVSGQIGILVGSHAPSRDTSKADVYEALDLYRKALHGGATELPSGPLVRLQWSGDSLEFSLPNHMCVMQLYNLKVDHYRIQNA